MRSVSISLLLAAASALVANAAPQPNSDRLIERQATSKLVFCHFMIGITSDRTSAAAYDDDMKRAKALGIDAFALNIGVDPYTDQQLGFAYQSAANNGMKVFISFDFNWYNTGQGSAIGAKIAQYAGLPAQLIVNNKVFASSFAGDGVDVNAIRSAAGRAIYFAPNFHPGQGDFSALDGALNWFGWENNGNNKAPSGGATVTVNSGDQSYVSTLAGKGYIAPASAWFSTHFGPEVSYSKNWVFPSDLLWYLRWVEILTLKPNFVEIVTWNDYGESHYIGPLSSPHTDDGGSKWVNDMPHGGWLDMAKPFIQAYKSGATSPNQFITSDQLIYWYRIAPKALNCDATDTTMQPANNASGNYFEGRPNGFNTMADSVFVVALLTSAGVVTVNSGGTLYTYNAPAGASALAVPFHVGAQAFALSRNGAQVMSATSLKLIQNVCPCGLYNFNAYVGSVPPQAPDALQPDGLAAFANGLKVGCAPTPSLPATPPSVTAATTTIVATAAPTAPV
ncbi:putative alpha-1,3-glucanase/mutanase [Mycena pura]|uniref:Alpha-1,3-glucanase/mutanase n=1 Tax=Mycena pura TaxID=153505 RepID=A0AAD6URL6_9AGAR|nr:putative alpha-1,3-glucanase/mutanase [Mycena pura]